jgi:2-dehydro-3-deoxy-D-arabinonate dehydratase
MRLYRTASGLVMEQQGSYYTVEDRSFDSLVADDDLHAYLFSLSKEQTPLTGFDKETCTAPIESQEVWAAGVTYYRSRSARIAESKDAGGGDFYDRIYSAERPELFFKSMPRNVVGPGQPVRIRKDATWSVPEPELALLINPRAQIIGYTIGNDMSSRDIEGQNPLYLPQAKVYDQSCALGPCIAIPKDPLPESTAIQLEILRTGQTVFAGATALTELKRSPQTLVEYLFRDHSFPHGCFLLTGTGIVPPDAFTLQTNDEIRITIEGIGTLTNFVA